MGSTETRVLWVLLDPGVLWVLPIVDNKTEVTGLVINDGPICSGM